MNEKQVIALLLNQSEVITGKFNNTINEILRLGYNTERGQDLVPDLVNSINYSLEELEITINNINKSIKEINSALKD